MIQVSHLTKIYGPRTAINDLNFEIKAGEIVGFLGPNGAGKSTTMKILTGFMPATSGTAKIAGYDVFENPIEVKRNVGFLPENPPLYFEMTVADYLEFAATIHGVDRQKIKKSVHNALEKTALTEVRNRLIGNLSKGYKQRVGLAQALVHDPKVLILDEASVGLDPKQIIEIRQLIKGLGGEHTVILSSHILPEVTATCQRIIVINKGQIVATDTIEELTRRINKGQSYLMTVQSLSDEGLKALRSISGVKQVSSQDQKISIELGDSKTEIRPQLLETALKNGMGVLEFSAEKLSLEEIFLQLTTVENHTQQNSGA
jgi:ABC-2 type transport system ATP-binding protein